MYNAEVKFCGIEKMCEINQRQIVVNVCGSGEAGYTPIKGVDYFTEEDIKDVAELALASLGAGEAIRPITLEELEAMF